MGNNIKKNKMEKCNKNNKDRKKEYNKQYYENNKDKIKVKGKQYYEDNKDKIKVKGKQYRENSKDKIKQYYENNKDKINKYRRKYSNILNINIKMRLRNNFYCVLKKYTKKGKIKSSNEYGINYKAIIEHLKPFPKNQSEYHIDHIRPLCSFNFINEDGTQNLEEIRKAFAPENHQWLLVEENLSKNGKWGTKEQVRYLFI